MITQIKNTILKLDLKTLLIISIALVSDFPPLGERSSFNLWITCELSECTVTNVLISLIISYLVII
jgi:hypothetical protein